jgi:hypothetical protein
MNDLQLGNPLAQAHKTPNLAQARMSDDTCSDNRYGTPQGRLQPILIMDEPLGKVKEHSKYPGA